MSAVGVVVRLLGDVSERKGRDTPGPNNRIARKLDRDDVSERKRPPGAGLLLCVDGPAGSGKTTLAEAVAAEVAGSRVVHMDDLFEGWGGLPRIHVQLEGLLRPLALGRAGSYRRWDWYADAWAETVTVTPVPLLVLEGVGSGTWRSPDLLVWVEAPYDVRLRRGLERDGDAFAPHWEHWAAEEERHFARERTRERADLLVDGRDGTVLE